MALRVVVLSLLLAWLGVALLLVTTIADATDAAPVFHNITYIADDRTGKYCIQPKNAVPTWRHDWHSKEYYTCLKHPTQDGYWAMLNAYRSGGKKGDHWKYSTDRLDPQCLKNWTYYGKDGLWVVLQNVSRITSKGDPANRNWCPRPVAQVKKKTKEPTGVEGNQWAFCTCTDTPPN